MLDRPTAETSVRPGGTGDDWLLDEVAVDFPSMVGLVEQMRVSFFGADAGGFGETHTAEVKLTVREAGEGVEVPMDLPVRPTCPVCGGRGEVWPETCGMCAGTGGGLLSHQFQLRVPAGVRHGTRLTYCVTPPFASETQLEVRIAIS